MSNYEDTKDIMFAYLFKLKLKKRYKETKWDSLLKNA